MPEERIVQTIAPAATWSAWQYTTEQRDVVQRSSDQGDIESCIATRQDVVDWVDAGNEILDPPEEE